MPNHRQILLWKDSKIFEGKNVAAFSRCMVLIKSGLKVASKEVKAEDPRKFNVSSVSRHLANLCSGYTTSNQVQAKMKTITTPSIIWLGNIIKCMKSVNTLQCKFCMQARVEISKRFKLDKTNMINDKADLFSSCTCEGHFDTFMTCGKKYTEDKLCFEKSISVSQLKKEIGTIVFTP